MLASVIVPTRGKNSRLMLVLDSLSRVTTDWTEIVVVINSVEPPKDLQMVLAQFRFASALVAQEPSLCPSVARCRNVGARRASGEVIIFLDDDIVVPPGIIEAHVRCQQESGGLLLLGLRDFVESDNWIHLSEGDEWTEFFVTAPRHRDPRLLAFETGIWQHAPWAFVAGCHLSIPRTVFSKVGGFDPDYIGWGLEDTDFGLRCFKQHVPIHVLSEVAALHLDPIGVQRTCDGRRRILGFDQLAEYRNNVKLFLRKHGEDPAIAPFIYQDMARHVMNHRLQCHRSPNES